MNILKWGQIAVRYILTSVGMVVWLGSAAVLSLFTWSTLGGENLDELARRWALIFAIWLGIVVSVLSLRFTGRFQNFLLILVASAMLASYGIGASRALTELSIQRSRTAELYRSLVEAQRAFEARSSPPTRVASSSSTIVIPDIGQPPIPTPVEPMLSGATKPPSAESFKLEVLRFNKPERMRINRSYIVEAQIGAAQIETLGDVGLTTERRVPIPDKGAVRVELISDQLEVEKLHEVDTVTIAPGTTALWSWKVTPRMEGENQRLLLQVFGSIRGEGGVSEVLVKTYRETIQVDVTPVDRAQLWGQAFLRRWDVVAGIAGAIGGVWLLISNVVAFLKARRKRKALELPA